MVTRSVKPIGGDTRRRSFPEIVRVPLLNPRPGSYAGASRPISMRRYSTDLTASIYALLGYTGRTAGPVRCSSSQLWDHLATDRNQRYCLELRTGLRVLRDNGQVLYRGRRQLARLRVRPQRTEARAVGVTAAMRQDDRSLIHESLRLTSLYHFTPSH